VLINASRDELHEKGTPGFIKGKVTLTGFPEFSGFPEFPEFPEFPLNFEGELQEFFHDFRL
jgi:hypothetical protein